MELTNSIPKYFGGIWLTSPCYFYKTRFLVQQ